MIFAILWPPRLLFPPRSNAASTTTRVADTSHWATPCAAFSSYKWNCCDALYILHLIHLPYAPCLRFCHFIRWLIIGYIKYEVSWYYLYDMRFETARSYGEHDVELQIQISVSQCALVLTYFDARTAKRGVAIVSRPSLCLSVCLQRWCTVSI